MGQLRFIAAFLMKPENVSQVHNAINRFDKNLRYTIDRLMDIKYFLKYLNVPLYVSFTLHGLHALTHVYLCLLHR